MRQGVGLLARLGAELEELAAAGGVDGGCAPPRARCRAHEERLRVQGDAATSDTGAETWEGRPAGPVEVGIRLAPDVESAAARARAEQTANKLHPELDERSKIWADAYNQALMHWAIAKAVCQPDDIETDLLEMQEFVLAPSAGQGTSPAQRPREAARGEAASRPPSHASTRPPKRSRSSLGLSDFVGDVGVYGIIAASASPGVAFSPDGGLRRARS